MSKELLDSKTLYDHLVDSVGNFLYKEEFTNCKLLPEFLLNVMDAISDYSEEGKELFPEIIITNDLEKLIKTLPFCQIVEIGKSAIDIEQFNNVLKKCAPLAINSWIIFVEYGSEKFRYGMISVEISELSPTFYRQIIGDLSEADSNLPIAFIKNVGNKNVILEGSKSKLNVLLSLSKPELTGESKIKDLVESISSNIENDIKEVVIEYYEKLIDDSNKVGHGTLIGVISDDAEEIKQLNETIIDGVYLGEPIDIVELIKISESTKQRDSSTNVRLYTSLIKEMINTDGITIFTNKGRLLAYHVFIKTEDKQVLSIVGGARSRAFIAMKESNLFDCCFYKSQDGKEKIWKKDE